jgi:hypothetical protein
MRYLARWRPESSSVSILSRAVSNVRIEMSQVFRTVGSIKKHTKENTRNMAKESPAEKMHNRILNGTHFSTRDVTADAFELVAKRAGTLALPDIKRGLEMLRALDNRTK